MNASNSGLAHGTNGSPQTTLENGDAERKAAENKNSKVALPTDKAKINHIFRNAPGHLPDTPQNRKKLLRLAQDRSKFKGTDRYGNSWHIEETSDGKQTWVRHRDGIINEGGQNDTPRRWNSETGLNQNPVKRRRRKK